MRVSIKDIAKAARGFAFDGFPRACAQSAHSRIDPSSHRTRCAERWAIRRTRSHAD